MPEIKVGDTVKIVSSTYVEHATRMAGGTGTVVFISKFAGPQEDVLTVEIFDGMRFESWEFYRDELEVIYQPSWWERIVLAILHPFF